MISGVPGSGPLRQRRVLALIAIVLTSAACGSSAGRATSSQPPAVPLEGTNWVLTEGAALGASVANTTAGAQFKGGTVSGNSGCNQYNAPYRVDGSKLTIGPQIVSTQMACEPAQTALERVFLNRLPKVASYSISGNTLTLSDQSSTPLLVFNSSSGAAALAGKWTVVSYYTGSALSSVVGGADLTALFEASTVNGNTGCNTFRGPLTVDGATIHIGPLATTLTACPSAELSAQEHSYVAALQLATTFKVTGNRLDLLRPGDLQAVTFTRG